MTFEEWRDIAARNESEAMQGFLRMCWAAGSRAGKEDAKEQITKLSSALSKIDYIVGEPNDMQMSLYDLDYDEGKVVERVRQFVEVASKKMAPVPANSVIGSCISKIDDPLAQYWDAAYIEGKQCRTHDTEEGLAQTLLLRIRDEFKAAYRAGQEDMRERCLREIEECYGRKGIGVQKIRALEIKGE